MPDAGFALRAGPFTVQRLDALQGDFHFACGGASPATVNLDVQRRTDICLQVLEQRLDRLEQAFRPLFERAPDAFEQLPDFPLVVRLTAAERERGPESLAHFLQQLLEAASRLGGRTVNVPVLETVPGGRKNPRCSVPRRPWAGRVAPRRQLELSPGRRSPAQMLEELLVVSEHDELPGRESVRE